MRILIINGPNLNLLGTREPGIYGSQSFESYFEILKETFPNVQLSYFQSNHEGQIIDTLHASNHDGIVINPGGLAHTSVVLADAIAAINIPCIEVHISDVMKREPFRHVLLSAASCYQVITGKGLQGYRMAINELELL